MIGAKLAGRADLTDAQRSAGSRLLLGLGHHRSASPSMALALVPALRPGRCPPPLPAELAPPRRAQGARAVGLDPRLRRRQPGGPARRLEPGPARAAAACPRTSYAFIFFQLPHGLLAVSITTTFAPDLARAWHRGDRQGAFIDRISLGVCVLALLVIPASIGYFVLARPLVVAALQRGCLRRRRPRAPRPNALAGFSARPVRLLRLPVRAARLLRAAGHATPFWINVVENALNIVLRRRPRRARSASSVCSASFALAYLLAAVVAARTCCNTRSAGSTWPACVASLARHRRCRAWSWARSCGSSPTSVGARPRSGGRRRALAGVVVGVVSYVVLLVVLRTPELGSVRTLLRRRPASAAPAPDVVDGIAPS